MESVTKWDLRSPSTYNSVEATENIVEDEPQSTNVASHLLTELWKSQLRIKELETDKILSEEKIKLLQKKQGRGSNEHGVDYLRHKLNRERKQRRRAEAVNSMLLKKVSDSESLLKRREKEREAIEELCKELMRRIEALSGKMNRYRDETEEERQMLQMAEVWREERVKMKLVDAKLALQEKYEEMNQIASEFEELVKVKRDGFGETSMRRGEGLMKMARSVNVSDQARSDPNT
ncbi:PREDICTED: stress response protein NST1-like [Tarenaya hassleriana]|uniref:stress response protein NST1-like n=1 Tax=Tarenaya hassleriana TaxID=28532 RepID=UPI00053C09AE|nr:PREDICTED: stress response protein NST1-like [Tarenaya hassleriana]XP_010554945.1 PREDICTED: stress response protein NST1-like [Tarenaya hassleriana]